MSGAMDVQLQSADSRLVVYFEWSGGAVGVELCCARSGVMLRWKWSDVLVLESQSPEA